MNSKIYGKLAVTNLKNNKKSYIPYILASAFSVMMYFTMDNLYRNRSLVEKGSPLAIMLSYAAAVILIFSIIFLFYINSFLIKRRKKELGIYNILGMGKGHLGKMLFLESVITTAASIIGGILAGILLGKLVYLILLKILHMGGKIEYRISLASIGMTTIFFGAIFILIFLYNLLQMKLSNPIELLRGGNTGEREPKTKWIMTIIGILCLAGGYSIALITKEPMAAGDYTNSNTVDLVMIPLSDYNQTEGKNVKLKENEVLLYHRNHKRTHKKSDTEALKNKKVIQLNSISYKVVDELDRLAIAKADTTSFIDGWYVVVKDSSIITSYLKDIYENSNIYDELKEYYGKIQYSYSFNLNGSRANRAKTEKSIQKQLQKKFANCSIESRELSRESFYELYGGFLFIGIFLGIIFLMATTLIIYYKQISEGYDDRERYQIMHKVGMSKKEVRQSIRSQVLLVFFLPLIMAVIHLAFAFKIITKLLSVLNLTNISLFFMYTVGTVAVFAVIYAIIYSITAKEYYKIIICRGE